MNIDTTALDQQKEFGLFINQQPLQCDWMRQDSWCWLWKVDIWEYIANPDSPFGWMSPMQDITLPSGRVIPAGTGMQPNKDFYTDFGSIPPPLMALPTYSRTRFIHAYLLHDSAYCDGGLWMLMPTDTAYHLVSLVKGDVDYLLDYWVGADGGNFVQRQSIYWAVELATSFIQYPHQYVISA